MHYYYLSYRSLDKGDVVKPGAWGHTVLTTPGHRFLKMEQQFEAVRLSINPSLPSRFDCIFLFDNYEMARKLQKLQRPSDKLYEVRIMNQANPMHVADFMLVHPELERWGAQWGNPKLYWTSANIGTTELREILTTSDIEIVKELKDIS